MTKAKPAITDTTMTAIFHGSIRFIALSIWITICIEENNMEKFSYYKDNSTSCTKSYLAQLSSADKPHRMR